MPALRASNAKRLMSLERGNLGDLATRVLVFAPLGRDAEVLRRVLFDGGIACTICSDPEALAKQVNLGVGAILLTMEALAETAIAPIAAIVEAQPAWSDLPLVVLADSDQLVSRGGSRFAALRGAANVTLLERPARGFTLVTVLQSALRARFRQYQTRDLLEGERGARDEAERANRIKDEFLATVSHELRTPLSAILLWSRLAASGRVPSEELPKTLELIRQSAAAQSALVEDLLDAARIMSGKLLVVPREVQLAPAVSSALDVVRPSAEAKAVRLEAVIDPEAGLVRADLGRMQQVVWNLLTNAVKFTPPEGAVRITLRRHAGQVQLQVADTGRGIGSDFIPHIFEPFRQAEAGSTRPYGGLGLGLAIAKQLVELHGGTITAESAGPMRGAIFTVQLPLARA